MRDFRKLQVWQKAHRLTLEVYRLSKRFPKEEMFGLTSQLRRATASISANIAESCGRQGESEFSRFLHIAAGSACEAEYHMLLAHELEYLPKRNYDLLNAGVCEVKRMLT